MTMTTAAPASPQNSRPSLHYGPGFELPCDNEENRAIFRGVEKLSDRRRYGHAVPRLFTPPLRELVSEESDEDVVEDDGTVTFGRVTRAATTWGYSVIAFAEDVLELELFPWQRWLLIHLLELNEKGSLRFQTAVVLIARQNGKSTLSQVLSLWFMIVREWPLVLGTAQDLTTAEEVWNGAVDLLQADPELNSLIERVVTTNGKFALVLAGDKKRKKRRWLVKAANRKAGRGLSGNLILMDELREQQTWASWGAITKTTQAQDDLLILALSNAGDVTSVVLRHLRVRAHIALGDPDGIAGDGLLEMSSPSALDQNEDFDDEFDDPDDMIPDGGTLFLAEWSATPGLPVKDRYGWAQANPSLGHRIRITKIAADAKDDPEWIFRTEVLCQWPDSILDGPFPAGSWEKGTNDPLTLPDGSKGIRPEHRLEGDLVVCFDQSMSREVVYACVAGFRVDGQIQVELWVQRAGSDWAKSWLQDDPKLKGRILAATGQTRGAPVSALMLSLKEAFESAHDPFRVPIEDWAGGDLMIASAELFDAVRDVTVFHNMQQALDIAASTATMKLLGDGFVLDRRNSLADIAPLMAFCGALWLLRKQKPKSAGGPLPLDDDELNDADEGTLTGSLFDQGF